VVIAWDIRRRLGFGVGTYVRNIIRTLARIDKPGSGPGHRYILVGTPDNLREHRGLPENFVLQPFATQASSMRSILAFRELLVAHRVDLLHVPHMFKTPRLSTCPYVVTVHDILDFLNRKDRQTRLQTWLRFELARFGLRRARCIVAVSNSTKQDVMRTFGLKDETKIQVAYNAIDERFLAGHASAADQRLLAERYQINYPFLLYAGSGRPHKNVGRLIEAFSALKAELKKDDAYPDLKLIIIGEDLSSNATLRRTMIRSGVQHDVRFLGFVPIDALRVFYDVAKIFVFPSLYEGFGLPPLEAMAHGTPVVTSNTSSLPEVVGNSAVLVNPENSFEIMHALRRVLLDQELRELLKIRGYAQAAKFSWEASARKLLEIYEQAAAR
jgi:glycosyltransferase involved in cell wall biosynthesis